MPDDTQTCPFCSSKGIRLETELCAVRRDNFPVAEGHTLITPKRHVPNYFDCTRAEKQALWELVDLVQQELLNSTSATAFTVGINVGETAGQTVPHAHIHVIPRYPGDVDDPRGGIRGVLPHKQRY